jgi:hypothetical protein
VAEILRRSRTSRPPGAFPQLVRALLLLVFGVLAVSAAAGGGDTLTSWECGARLSRPARAVPARAERAPPRSRSLCGDEHDQAGGRSGSVANRPRPRGGGRARRGRGLAGATQGPAAAAPGARGHLQRGRRPLREARRPGGVPGRPQRHVLRGRGQLDVPPAGEGRLLHARRRRARPPGGRALRPAGAGRGAGEDRSRRGDGEPREDGRGGGEGGPGRGHAHPRPFHRSRGSRAASISATGSASWGRCPSCPGSALCAISWPQIQAR